MKATGSGATPCYGKSALFDSTDLYDHMEAKELCDTCPAILACARNLGEVKRTSGVYGYPEGTWAGRLELPRGWRESREESTTQRQERIAQEEALYTDESAKRAHNAYGKGDRTEWAKTGHRVYQRRKTRERDGEVA